MEEELGVKSKKIKKIGEFLAAPRRSIAKMHVFLAEDISVASQKLEDSETIDLVYYSKDQVINMIKKGKIIQNNTLSALMILQTID
jgi:ADP-ribose pyrophosphatase